MFGKTNLLNYDIIISVLTQYLPHFLTGNKTDIYRLARQSYFAEEDIGTWTLEIIQLVDGIKTLEAEK